jgi:hypothetical protein
MSLPLEIALYVMLCADIQTVCRAKAVSRAWNAIANGKESFLSPLAGAQFRYADNVVWRYHFYQQPLWGIRPEFLEASTQSLDVVESSSSQLSPASSFGFGNISQRLGDVVADLSGLSLSSPPDKGRVKFRSGYDSGGDPPSMSRATSASSCNAHTPVRQSHATVTTGSPLASALRVSRSTSVPLALDWPRLYRDRYLLDRRWDEGSQVAKTLKGHGDSVYCLQMDAKKIVTGSVLFCPSQSFLLHSDIIFSVTGR